MIHLYDGNNFLRRLYEFDTSGLPLRNLYHEMRNGMGQHTYIWVFDGVDSKAKRRAIFPEYKEGRKPTPDGFVEVKKVFKEILKYVPAIQITVPETEADDVIATLLEQLNGEIELHSNDGDFLSFKGKPGLKFDIDMYDYCTPELVRLYKTICGDNADNISGIPGLGPKTFAKLPHDVWLDAFKRPNDVVFEQLGLTPKKLEWVTENWELMKKFWTIVGFIKVSDYNIKSNTVVGTNKPEAAEILLRAVMQ